jgi:hypothetical protein
MDFHSRLNYYLGDFLFRDNEITTHLIKYKHAQYNKIYFYEGPNEVYSGKFPLTLTPGFWWGYNGGFTLDIPCLANISDGYESNELPVMTKTRLIGKKFNGILYKAEYDRHWKILDSGFQDQFSWGEKKDDIVWRGVHSTGAFKKANRRLCVSKFYDKYNIGFSYVDKDCDYFRENQVYFKGDMTIPDMLQYKYLLCIEGNDVATGLKWMLASNSVVVMPEPTIESWLMEGLLKPFVHYVPVKDDFSDLEKVIHWCKENDDKCKEISGNATRWMIQFMNRENELKLHNKIKSWYSENVILNKRTYEDSY